MTAETFTHRGVTYRVVKQSLTTADPPCIHRGEVVREIKLSCCSGFDVRACQKHGTCVASKSDWDHARRLAAEECVKPPKCCGLCGEFTPGPH